MRLTPTDRDRLLIFTAAELARARRRRGLQLNVPEATALIADTVCEAARDGARLMDAAAAGAAVLGHDDVLPGVADIVREVKVEALFDDGTRMVVVRNPFGDGGSLGADAPGAVVTATRQHESPPGLVHLTATNTSDVPISITSHSTSSRSTRGCRLIGPWHTACAWRSRPDPRCGSSLPWRPMFR